MGVFDKKEASTPLVQLGQLKTALGFDAHLPTATIIQYIEDGLVSVKHGKDLPEQVITESQASSQAAEVGDIDTVSAPDVNDPAKVVETPTHRPEPTATKPMDAKAETDANKQDDSVTTDVKQAHKDAKAAEKAAPEGPTVVKDEDVKPLSAPVEDEKKGKK